MALTEKQISYLWHLNEQHKFYRVRADDLVRSRLAISVGPRGHTRAGGNWVWLALSALELGVVETLRAASGTLGADRKAVFDVRAWGS